MPAWWARELGAAVRLREIVRFLHRWLGLTSGLVVFVVGLTGALYVFAPELDALYTARYSRIVPAAQQPPLAVSVLAREAHAALERVAGPLPDLSSRWVTVSSARDRVALYVAYRDEPPAWYQVHVDPYRGDILAVRDMRWDPMEVVRRAHQALLLPHEIGHVIVGVAILVFVVLQASGVMLWLPRRLRTLRRSGALRQRLTVHWRGRARRVIYDLHRTLGVWGLLVALVIALSGLVWSFAWMDRAVYWVATGGGTKTAPPPAQSGPAGPDLGGTLPAERVLASLGEEFPAAAEYIVAFPRDARGAIEGCAKPDADTYYRMSCAMFDQYTGRRLRTDLYRDKNAGQVLEAMNYDIHVGQILGLPGRPVAFAASLAVASLPVTGVLTWWNRGRARKDAPPPTPALGVAPRPNSSLPRT